MPTSKQIKTLSVKEDITLNEAGKKLIQGAIDNANRQAEVKHIVGDDKQRAAKCAKEVNALLNSYDCGMSPQVILEPGQPIQGGVRVIAKKRGGPNHGGQ